MSESKLETPEKEVIDEILTDFEGKYHIVLNNLLKLSRGTFNEYEGSEMAAYCLLAVASLNKHLAEVAAEAKRLKNNVKFEEAESYQRAKTSKSGDFKLTEAAVTHLINSDPKVRSALTNHIEAEKQLKELETIRDIVMEAHVTFRSLKKSVG